MLGLRLDYRHGNMRPGKTLSPSEFDLVWPPFTDRQGERSYVINAGVFHLQSIIAITNGCAYVQDLFISGCSYVTEQAIRYLLDHCVARVYIQHKVKPSICLNIVVAKYILHNAFLSVRVQCFRCLINQWV